MTSFGGFIGDANVQVFDRNSDGYISKTELYQTMKELGVRLSMDDLNEMMTAADINRDGRIDYAGTKLTEHRAEVGTAVSTVESAEWPTGLTSV